MNKDIAEYFNCKKRQLSSQSKNEDDLKNNNCKYILKISGLSAIFLNPSSHQQQNYLYFLLTKKENFVSWGSETCFERKKEKKGMRTSRDIEDVLIIWKQNVIFVSISKILVCTFCFIPVVKLFLKNSRWQGDGGRIIFATKWSFCSVSRIMHK